MPFWKPCPVAAQPESLLQLLFLTTGGLKPDILAAISRWNEDQRHSLHISPLVFPIFSQFKEFHKNSSAHSLTSCQHDKSIFFFQKLPAKRELDRKKSNRVLYYSLNIFNICWYYYRPISRSTPWNSTLTTLWQITSFIICANTMSSLLDV